VGIRAAALGMVLTLIESAQFRWRGQHASDSPEIGLSSPDLACCDRRRYRRGRRRGDAPRTRGGHGAAL